MEQFIIKATVDNLGKTLDFASAELERNNIPAHLQPDILVAVEEIFVNITQYAYPPGQEGDVSLYISVDDKVIIRFEDTGQPFDPLEKADPVLGTSLMEREIGGLGIYLVKNLMDEAEYRYADGKNVFTVTKAFISEGKVK